MPTFVELAAGTLEVRTRAEWGSRLVTAPGDLDGAPEPKGYLHHEGGAVIVPVLTVAQEIQKMRDLQAYCIDAARQGWSDIPYNVCVMPSGRVYEGRGWRAQSGATADENTESKAVLLLGNFDRQFPFEAQLQAAALCFVWGVQLGELVAAPQILGHRENPDHPGATTCPGKTIDLDDFRARVTRALNPPPPPEEDPMLCGDLVEVTDHPNYPPGLKVLYVTDPFGTTYRWIRTEPELAGVKADRLRRGQPTTHTPCRFADLGRYGVLIGPTP